MPQKIAAYLPNFTKILCVAGLLIGGNIASFCQNNLRSIPFYPDWKKGTTYYFQLTEIEKNVLSNPAVTMDSTSTKLKFEVIDSTQTGYTVKWTYNPDKIDWSYYKLAPNELVYNPNESVFFIYENIYKNLLKFAKKEVIYHTSPSGELLEIVNWEAIANNIKQHYQEILQNLDERVDTNTLQKNEAIQEFLEEMSTQKGIENNLFEELSLFHYFYGRTYFTKRPNSFNFFLEDYYPTIFYQDIFYVDNINEKATVCTLIRDRAYDDNVLKKMLYQNLTEGIQFDPKALRKLKKSLKIHIYESSRVKYQMQLNIPLKIEHKITLKRTIGNTQEDVFNYLQIDWLKE